MLVRSQKWDPKRILLTICILQATGYAIWGLVLAVCVVPLRGAPLRSVPGESRPSNPPALRRPAPRHAGTGGVGVGASTKNWARVHLSATGDKARSGRTRLRKAIPAAPPRQRGGPTAAPPPPPPAAWVLDARYTAGAQGVPGDVAGPGDGAALGWALAAASGSTALLLGVAISWAVARARQCLDFASTFYVLHLCACCAYAGWPSPLQWWAVTGASLAAAWLLSEHLCVRRELEDIPLSALRSSRAQRGAPAGLRSAGSGAGAGAPAGPAGAGARSLLGRVLGQDAAGARSRRAPDTASPRGGRGRGGDAEDPQVEMVPLMTPGGRGAPAGD